MSFVCFRRIFSCFMIGSLAIALAPGLVHGDEKIGPRPNPVGASHPEEEKAIRAATDTFVKAFDKGDAKAIASMWVTHGDFVNEHGGVFRGRETIEKMFAVLFGDGGELKMELTQDSIRFLSPEIAITNATGRVRSGKEGKGSASRCTVVWVKQDGKWQMESVRESPYQCTCNYDHLKEIEWLIGNWKAQNGNLAMEMKCEWTASRNFMLCTHTIKDGDSILSSSTQVIGWDPKLDQIRSWNFDSEGGFGCELWTKDGKTWVLEAAGTRREGHTTQATNIITPVDQNSFTWQSVHRQVDGQAMPDTAVVKAIRVPSTKEAKK